METIGGSVMDDYKLHVESGLRIEKGVPIPSTAGRPSLYAAVLNQMVKGDSVVARTANIVAFRACAKRLGVKITTRRDTSTTHRIWRVK
jgi:hypothetical protein